MFGHSMHVRIECDEMASFACVEAMRAVDLSGRKCRSIGIANKEEITEVLDLIDLIGAAVGIR